MKGGIGAGAWVIATQNLDDTMSGASSIDGDPTTMQSTRAERGATIDSLYAILEVAKDYNIRKGQATLYVDNQASYTKGKAPAQGEGPYRHLGEDCDYKMIRKKIEEELSGHHNIDIQYKWVREHQDTKPMKDKMNKIIPLSPQAILNIHCDN